MLKVNIISFTNTVYQINEFVYYLHLLIQLREYVMLLHVASTTNLFSSVIWLAVFGLWIVLNKCSRGGAFLFCLS